MISVMVTNLGHIDTMIDAFVRSLRLGMQVLRKHNDTDLVLLVSHNVDVIVRWDILQHELSLC